MFGIDSFAAVINPPQAAILAVGAIEERPVARDGEIATAHLMRVNLACDHRILYGAQGAEFLARIVGPARRALLARALEVECELYPRIAQYKSHSTRVSRSSWRR